VQPRLIGAIVSVVAIAATLEPLVRDPARGDDFPLSTYPMFTAKRSGAQTFEYAMMVTGDGDRRTVGPGLVANYEVLQAQTAFQSAADRGERPALCARIADRIARDGGLGDVVRVEITRGTHEALPFLLHGTRGRERALVTCPVPR
jgi:hypothetical protein